MQTVLIVDDEQSFSYLLEVILQRAGYETMVAADGKEGLDMIQRYLPDVVILDESMPRMRGSEVYRRLKADPMTQHIPVIMHSSIVNVRQADLSEFKRADAFLPKPSLPREVLDKVRRVTLTSRGIAGQHAAV
jgi:CheY-like chemotaxis protein